MNKLYLIEVATLRNCDPKIVWPTDLAFEKVCVVNTDRPLWAIQKRAQALVQQHCTDQGAIKRKAGVRHQSAEVKQKLGLTQIHFINVREVAEVPHIKTRSGQIIEHLPVLEIRDTREERVCPECGNSDPQQWMGVQYEYDHPEHYDGVSEWHCVCGARIGRWSERVLVEGESELRFSNLTPTGS